MSPTALAPTASARTLTGSVASRAAWMASAVAPRTALAGTVASRARPSEPWLGVPLRPRGPPSLSETLTSSVAVELAPGPSAPRLTNGEVRRLAFRGLSFRSRQGGAYQTAVNRTIVLAAFSSSDGQVGALGFRRWIEWVCRGDINVGEIVTGLGSFGERFGAQRAFHRFTGSGFGAFSTRRRDLCPLEFMVRVAGGAACLLDLILNHGHHGMTGDAALAGTVVVQNVTEPKPALLH